MQCLDKRNRYNLKEKNLVICYWNHDKEGFAQSTSRVSLFGFLAALLLRKITANHDYRISYLASHFVCARLSSMFLPLIFLYISMECDVVSFESNFTPRFSTPNGFYFPKHFHLSLPVKDTYINKDNKEDEIMYSSNSVYIFLQDFYNKTLPKLACSTI